MEFPFAGSRMLQGRLVQEGFTVGRLHVATLMKRLGIEALYHQPITRDGLKDIFGKEISRDLIGRLHSRDSIGPGPRSPRRGAPYTFVTTEQFLVAFDLETLADLPDRKQLEDAGLDGGS